MLTMGITASLMALKHGITNSNFLGGFTAVYFVVTALTTVRPVSAWTKRVNLGAAVFVLALGLFMVGLGVKTIAAGRMMLNGVPVPMLLFLGTIQLTAGIGDVRVMLSGALRGAPRLTRHLWRMCFALFIAAGSFFSIRSRVAKILPEPFLSAPMRILPILLVFAAMFFWIWRLRSRKNLAAAL